MPFLNKKAPPLEVSDWLNTKTPLTLSGLKGQVVVVHTFQMLCPGCVMHGTQQAKTIYENFNAKGVQVIGLHTVFEHHDVMDKKALEVFIHEFKIPFPVAIDKPSKTGTIPMTMEKHQLRGTPSMLIIDKAGNLALSHFGQISDMQIGAIIGQLLMVPELT